MSSPSLITIFGGYDNHTLRPCKTLFDELVGPVEFFIFSPALYSPLCPLQTLHLLPADPHRLSPRCAAIKRLLLCLVFTLGLEVHWFSQISILVSFCLIAM